MPDRQLTWTEARGDAIRQWWPTCREGFSQCVASDRHGPLVEDVYTAIRLGRARLWILLEAGEYRGAMTVQDDINPYRDDKKLHVWLLTAGAHGLLHDGMEALRCLLRPMGYTGIVFTSPRDGWGPALGAKQVETLFEIGV